MSEIGIKDQCFGVEVEMTGITREQAAHALADYFGTSPQYLGTGYDTWGATDPEGKVWKLMSDASIRAERKTRTGYTSNAGTSYRVEMVTPKLTYEELPKFQECIRRVRAAGAKVNSSCGIHVHVDAANHNRQSLKNLIGIMYSKEDILFKALQVNESRASRWCQKVREPMLRQARTLSSEETKDLTQLESIWYEGDIGNDEHYNWTRYYALNLHSVFYRGTVEWRCFNSTLHAGPQLMSICVWRSPPRLSPSAAPSCARPAATTNCSRSGCGWCAWGSTETSSNTPEIIFWQIWRVTVPGDMTRTVMRSIGKRRNNEKRRGDADEDTDRRNHI